MSNGEPFGGGQGREPKEIGESGVILFFVVCAIVGLAISVLGWYCILSRAVPFFQK